MLTVLLTIALYYMTRTILRSDTHSAVNTHQQRMEVALSIPGVIRASALVPYRVDHIDLLTLLP